MADDVLSQVRESLEYAADEKTRQGSQRFFREKIKVYGVKLPVVNQIARESYGLLKSRTKDDILSLCEELWCSGYFEESIIACHWTYRLRKNYSIDDFRLFEYWIEHYVTNWASCDTFCNHTVGSLIAKYPHLVVHLKTWALSSNRWMRRAAAVSLIVPAKKGLFLEDILEIATILLKDADDLVQKGYGWLLKVTAGPHLETVFDFVMANKKEMPRTALRYAIEKMPQDLKTLAMER